MTNRAHSLLNAVLPPDLAARLNTAILRKVEGRLLADKTFFSRVIARADLLEAIVFDDETPSWGPWPLWLDDDGLEL